MPKDFLQTDKTDKLQREDLCPGLVLCICTGNTCRSPMAEVIFNALAEGSPWWAASAGLAALPGDPAMYQAQEAVAQKGLSLSKHASRRINLGMLEEAALIITMTESHKQALLHHCPQIECKLFSFGEIAKEDIPDPYGSNLEIYQKVADELEKGLKILWENLQTFTGKA